MLDLERRGNVNAAALKPQHVDQPDGVGSLGGSDGGGQALEAVMSQRRSVKWTAPVVGRNPDVIAKG